MTMMQDEWVEIGGIEEIPRRGARVVKSPVGDIAVFRAMDDSIFALEDRCPHKGGPLSQGIVQGHAVNCPLHNWLISLETGKAHGADEGCARTVPVKLQGGRILLGLSALISRAA
jgi:nitrite reductase (NADH) small subunit